MNRRNVAREKFTKLNFNPNNLPFFDIHEPIGHCKNNNKINCNEITKLISSLFNAFLLTPPMTRSKGNVTWIKAKEVVIKTIDRIIMKEFLFHFLLFDLI